MFDIDMPVLRRLRTSLCLQFKPHHIAAGAIFLAAKFLKVKLPSDEKSAWWQEFDVTPSQLEEVSNQMLELYEQNKTGAASSTSASARDRKRVGASAAKASASSVPPLPAAPVKVPVVPKASDLPARLDQSEAPIPSAELAGPSPCTEPVEGTFGVQEEHQGNGVNGTKTGWTSDSPSRGDPNHVERSIEVVPESSTAAEMVIDDDEEQRREIEALIEDVEVEPRKPRMSIEGKRLAQVQVKLEMAENERAAQNQAKEEEPGTDRGQVKREESESDRGPQSQVKKEEAANGTGIGNGNDARQPEGIVAKQKMREEMEKYALPRSGFTDGMPDGKRKRPDEDGMLDGKRKRPDEDLKLEKKWKSDEQGHYGDDARKGGERNREENIRDSWAGSDKLHQTGRRALSPESEGPSSRPGREHQHRYPYHGGSREQRDHRDHEWERERDRERRHGHKSRHN
eukprot:TRINITY_DN7467_c0_g1_i3.p1 TRINITY_DN7467_c0_g1~~TRINITY_DN7467_c0_g1_i3.p1  ORF type:complete len:456 (-),score=118.70 TRINITY_DN7467_c0_g1_i3:560-1927(-)